MSISIIGLTLVVSLADAPRNPRAAAPPAAAPRTTNFGGPGWYRATLKSGEAIQVKILRKRGEYFDCQLGGTVLELHRSQLATLDPLSAGSSKADEALRDAVSDLGDTNRRTWLNARARLRKAFPDSRDVLTEALSNHESRIRVLAVQILGEEGKADEDGDLVARMFRDSNESVRRAAIFALRALGPFEKGKKALLGLIDREAEANLKKAAVKTLERWKARELAGDLVTRMEFEEDRGVRKFMGQALAYFLEVDFGDDVEAWRKHYDRVSGAEDARRQRLIEMMSAKTGASESN